MCCKRADLRRGAYLTHPTKGLFRVQGVRAGLGGVSEVSLTDECLPLDTESIPGTARFRVVEPEPVAIPTHRVLREFDLLRHGPDPADTASVAEYGHSGTAPT